MRVSRRGAVDPFIVMDVMEQARRLEATGRAIVHMEVGQPGTPAPAGARAALARAMEEGPLGYTVALGCRNCGRGSPISTGAGTASSSIRGGWW